MDYQQSQAAHLAKHSKNLNFDNLINAFICEDDPKNFHRHLLEVYYAVVEHAGADDAFSSLVDSLYHLRLIIQAIEAMENLDGKQLEIVAK